MILLLLKTNTFYEQKIKKNLKSENSNTTDESLN